MWPLYPQHSALQRASISFRLHTTRGYCGGYDLTYSSSEAGPGCGSEVGGTRGVVTSPGYPGVTNTSGDCWWVVRVPQGQRIQLRSVNDQYSMPQRASTNQVYLRRQVQQSNSLTAKDESSNGGANGIVKSKRS